MTFEEEEHVPTTKNKINNGKDELVLPKATLLSHTNAIMIPVTNPVIRIPYISFLRIVDESLTVNPMIRGTKFPKVNDRMRYAEISYPSGKLSASCDRIAHVPSTRVHVGIPRIAYKYNSCISIFEATLCEVWFVRSLSAPSQNIYSIRLYFIQSLIMMCILIITFLYITYIVVCDYVRYQLD